MRQRGYLVEKGGHFENMLIRPLRLGPFWLILYIKFFEVYLSQSNKETFCCNLFQVKCYISPAKVSTGYHNWHVKTTWLPISADGYFLKSIYIAGINPSCRYRVPYIHNYITETKFSNIKSKSESPTTNQSSVTQGVAEIVAYDRMGCFCQWYKCVQWGWYLTVTAADGDYCNQCCWHPPFCTATFRNKYTVMG